MCKISVYQYTCKHHIQHIWSACRGQVKVAKDSNTPACQKSPSLYVKATHKCGSCSRAEAEQNIRRELEIAGTSAESQAILEQQLVDMTKQIPSTNWRLLPSPTYTRKPSQKRLQSQRRHSLLREEVLADDACGPEAWEDNVVLPVYETVEDGWNNWEWTSETKSLEDEIAEDAAERGDEEKDDEEDEEDGDGDGDGKAPAKDDCGVRYWFRQHKSITPGEKVGFRNWELVVVQAN